MRIICFGIVCALGLFTPIWFFLGAGLVYALVWNGYELLIPAILIDAQFGSPHLTMVPYVYTLSLGVIMIGVEFLKPYFRFY